MTPDICPVCGEDVPARAKVCPGCGADEETGWSEKARYDELGIPDDSFEYDEYVQREFGGRTSGKGKRNKVFVVGAILLALALVPGGIYLLTTLFGSLFQR